MRHPRLAALGLAAVTTIVVSGTTGVAHADPANAKNVFPIQVACDNGHTYNVVANGNGQFTPAHDLDSNAVLIPVAFGETTFTVTDSSGTVVATETQPPVSKGSSASNPAATTSCSFSGSAVDPETGDTFAISGTVVGFVTPAH